MKRSRRAALLILGASLGTLAVVGYRLHRQRLVGATPAEIRAVLPPELLEQTPVDVASTERYREVMALMEGFDEKAYPGALGYGKVPANQLLTEAASFQAKNVTLTTKVEGILKRGPIQTPSLKAQAADTIRYRSLAKCLRVYGKSLFDAGRTADGVDFECKSWRMAKALTDSLGDALYTFYDGLLLERAALRAIQPMSANAGLTASDCAKLLTIIPPATSGDENLRIGIRATFQDFGVKDLGNPRSMAVQIRQLYDTSPEANKQDGQILGTYDAIATAKTYASVLVEAMANARKPYSAMAFAARNAAMKDAEELPRMIPSLRGEPEELAPRPAYASAMNGGPNTVGRLFVGSTDYGGDLEESCRIRARQDCVRVALAAAIYRSSHGGLLPPTKDGLVPILGAWPTDPFNGKAMCYDATKAMVYSVGENLKDDGGNPNSDIVASLERKK